MYIFSFVYNCKIYCVYMYIFLYVTVEYFISSELYNILKVVLNISKDDIIIILFCFVLFVYLCFLLDTYNIITYN